MANTALVLRDIHQPPAPPWWPPAPGWWLLFAAVLAVVALVWWWRRRRERRRRDLFELFDRTVDAANTPSERVAAMSALLRRAARRRDADADRLQGEAWLAFLDAPSRRRRGRTQRRDVAFSEGPGRLLLDGGYRPDADPAQVEALRVLARNRFLQWMSAA